MSKSKQMKTSANRLRLFAKIIIIAGVLTLITPYVLRYLYHQSAMVLALEMEDQLGAVADNYAQVDYSQLNIASPSVYTPEQLAEAQQSPSILDDFILFGDGQDTADTSEQTVTATGDSYLLEIPSISLKICVLRCSSFKQIYKCMRSGAAIFPDAPQPDEIGNICMSAHRTGSRDYFRNLDQITAGDIIYLHYAKNTSYQYQVLNVSVIEPDDWSVTGQTLYPALTLLSCQEYQGVSHGRRIMVRAKLIGVSK